MTIDTTGLPVLWGRVTSSNVQKVMWLCAELGIAYERREAGLQHGIVNEPFYRAMNPNGLVPTLADGQTVVWESNSILRYLADTHGGERLYPREAGPRSRVERWLDWQLGTLAPAMSPLFHALVRTPPGQQDPARIAALAAGAAAVWTRLDAWLAGNDHMAGLDFSLADIAMGNAIHRWSVFAIEKPALPHLEAWHARLRERPGFRDCVAAVPVV